MLILPTYNETQYRMEISISGLNYIMIFSWNALNEYWTMQIYDRDFNPIVYSIKIVTQFNLTQQLVAEGMPNGDIYCQNIHGGFQKITRTAMGESNELVFYSEDELG